MLGCSEEHQVRELSRSGRKSGQGGNERGGGTDSKGLVGHSKVFDFTPTEMGSIGGF